MLRRMTGGGPAGKGGDALEAEEPALRKGTGGAEGLPARKLSDKVLEAPVRDGGGSGAGGFGGGGGLDLICASQLIFLLGWLVIWSRVFLTLLAPASATLAALLRSSSIVGSGNRVCENSKESAQMGVAVTSLTFEGWHDVVIEFDTAFERLLGLPQMAANLFRLGRPSQTMTHPALRAAFFRGQPVAPR